MIGNSVKARLNERKMFIKYGKCGQLINTSFDVAKLKVDPVITALSAFDQINTSEVEEFMIRVFDTFKDDWRVVHMYEIPKTYSFMPIPSCPEMELEYFLRSSCLPKHEIIWSTKSIPRNTFAKIASNLSRENLGRFTIAPWLPKIKNTPKEAQYGFIEYDVDENDLY